MIRPLVLLMLLPLNAMAATPTAPAEPTAPDEVGELEQHEDSVLPSSEPASETPPDDSTKESTVEEIDVAGAVDHLPPVPQPTTTRALYDDAVAALGADDRDRARTLLRQLRRDHARTWETAALARRLGQARPAEERLLRFSEISTTRWGTRLRPEERESVLRTVSDYSRATHERASLSWWEKTDFVLTSLAYGGGIGGAYAYGLELDDAAVVPMMLGVTIYGTLSAGLLTQADRGDLPLALGVAAYVPVTALMAGLAADADEEDIGLAVAISGTAALPAAGLLAAFTDLDPGDTQLTRDAGFWGIVFALSGTAGFGCLGDRVWCSVDESTYGVAGLVGLYAGLGAGALLAEHTEVSLDRVRTTTLVGYLGGLIGAFAGAGATTDGETGVGRGVLLGSAAGLALGILATMNMDLPEDVGSLVLMPAVDRHGKPVPAVGVELYPGR